MRFPGTSPQSRRPPRVQSGRELQSALKDKVPTKIDIGPVYSQDPAKRAAYKGDTSAAGFKPLERELVFDIDLTDYDDVRNSSSGTGMSRKCWLLMHAAIQVRPHCATRTHNAFLHTVSSLSAQATAGDSHSSAFTHRWPCAGH